MTSVQRCGQCHNRGYYFEGTVSTPCSCSAGQAIAATARVRALLSTALDQRMVDLWLSSGNKQFAGERPIDLLRAGREEEVLRVVVKIPGVAAREPVVAASEPVAEAPVLRGMLPAERDSMDRAIREKLIHAGYRRIAEAVRYGGDLDDHDQAVLDAAVTGAGYLVGGKRVDPATVLVIRWS